jgi:RNA recognition motif-containing protein
LQSARGINKKIFVRGLPDSVTSEALQECLESYGEITNVVIHKFSHLHSCTAVVTFRDLSSAFSVIDELHNSLLFGRLISVDFALLDHDFQMRAHQRLSSLMSEGAGGEGERGGCDVSIGV